MKVASTVRGRDVGKVLNMKNYQETRWHPILPAGNLRNINKIAVTSLMFGASLKLTSINEDIIYKATSEL